MSLEYKKHNPKSFVVRGDIIDNIKSRQQLISKLSGKCVYNTRLKFGSGLLVPINEVNEHILKEYGQIKTTENDISLSSVIVPYEGSDNKSKLDDIIMKLINETDDEDEKNEPLIVSNSENTFTVDNNSTSIKVIQDHSEKQQKPKNKNNNKNQHKDKQVSIIDTNMSDNKRMEKKSNGRDDKNSRDVKERSNEIDRRNNRNSRDNRDTRDNRNTRNERDKREDRDRRSRSRRHDSSSNESTDSYSSDSSDSSDYSGDSSEDERIQETIRRKGQHPDRKKSELNDSDVDSDHEDIVTLSRRVRYLVRKVKSIEEYLRK
jgi:hypothetical protein|uniref:Uncharacterized protein n=1 Tax=viral metagenome TaxID=1070528 RepID=A0A6C0I5D0_9ZZZZ